MAKIAPPRSFEMLGGRRLLQAVADFVRRNSGHHLLGVSLTIYAALWTLYFSIANATVDVHFDLSEASVWSQTLALGYKHPPMTAWIFHAWFEIFPRADWAAHLLAVTNVVATLAVTWVLMRDYLGKERALIGIAALVLVPLYTFLAWRFNANTVMMPFWAATVLFYLRARRNARQTDAIFAGVFAGLTLLGKYWGVYLVAGMAIVAFAGADVRRFWRSGAPLLMAIAALVVLAPHVYWLLTERDHAFEHFLATSVVVPESFGAALRASVFYLAGAVGYVIVPLIFFAALMPDRATLRDTIWPTDPGRRQAMLLLALPLLLPAIANLIYPHRLTPLWTFPNWALLPVILFGSPQLKVTTIATARSCLIALAFSLAAVMVSPLVARSHLDLQKHSHDAHYRQTAAEIARLADSSTVLIGGSEDVVQGLFYYLPAASPMNDSPATETRGKSPATPRVMVCIEEDAACRSAADSLAGKSGSVSDLTFARTFLGFSSPPVTYRIAVAPGSPSR